MVKRNNSNSDIDLLLGILLLSSVIIAALQYWPLRAENNVTPASAATQQKTKQKNTQVADAIENPLKDASATEVATYIREAIRTDSIEAAIKMLAGIPLKTVVPVLKHTLDNSEHTPQKRDDRIELILGLAATYKDQKDQYAILDFILDPNYLYLRKGTPIFYIAAYGDFPDIIRTIKSWYSQRIAAQPKHAELLAESEIRALTYAVQHKKLAELKMMVAHGIALDKQRMDALLVEAIESKAGCPIIGFLLDKGGDINGVHKGYTPLLKAIENNDLPAVRLLVKRGADTNKLGDNAIGNPRQIANEALEKAVIRRKEHSTRASIQAAKDAVTIERLLIDNGATD